MDSIIREFALQMLRKLQKLQPPAAPVKPVVVDGDASMNGENPEAPTTSDTEKKADEPGAGEVPPEISEEKKDDAMDTGEHGEDGGGQGVQEVEDEESGQEDLVHTPYLPERIELPAKKAHVLQHVELSLALSVKVPEFFGQVSIHFQGVG